MKKIIKPFLTLVVVAMFSLNFSILQEGFKVNSVKAEEINWIPCRTGITDEGNRTEVKCELDSLYNGPCETVYRVSIKNTEVAQCHPTEPPAPA